MDTNRNSNNSSLMATTTTTPTPASIIEQLLPQRAPAGGSPWPDACSVAPIYLASLGNSATEYGAKQDERAGSLLFGPNASAHGNASSAISDSNFNHGQLDQAEGLTSSSPFYTSLGFNSDSSISNRIFNLGGNNLIGNLNNQLSSTSDSNDIFSGNSSFSSGQASEMPDRRHPRPGQPNELSGVCAGRTYSSVLHSTGQSFGPPAFQRQHEQHEQQQQQQHEHHQHHLHQQQQAGLQPTNHRNPFGQQMSGQSRFMDDFLGTQRTLQVPYQRVPRHQHPAHATGGLGLGLGPSPALAGTSSVASLSRAAAGSSGSGSNFRADKMFPASPPAAGPPGQGSALKRRNKLPFFAGSAAAATAGHLADGPLSFKLDAFGTSVIGSEGSERFSRKVFVGGLPPDIDEEEIKASFRRFGSLVVDWPHKAESKSYFPPKGYAFLLFQEEASVQSLIDSCFQEDDKLYLCVSSPTIKDKPVQIRPWRLNDSDFVLDSTLALDPRKTVFVGGVPRPLKACELAIIMNNLYGGVSYAGIDTDPELKYPKGAGRVAFSNHESYIAAISARFVHIHHCEIEKRVEVKPYVLDDQFCDECRGSRSNNKFAPFFCANITCLRYYCDNCWSTVHSQPGKEFHKPLVKEGGDRPRVTHQPPRW